MTVLPVFGAIVLARLTKNRLPNLAGSLSGVAFSALLVGAPILLAYPIHPQGASQVIDPLLAFAKMGSADAGSGFERFWDAFGFYGQPLGLVCLVGLTFLLAASSKGFFRQSLKVVLPLAVAANAVLVWTLLFVLVDKGAIYLATYALNISVFLPIGIFITGTVRVWPHLQVLICWLLIGSNLLLSPHFEGWVAGRQDYAATSSGSDIQRKLVAAGEIQSLIGKVPAGTKVLLDSTSVFPVSHIGTGVPIYFVYGDLADRLASVSGRPDFKYIVLDSYSYWGGPTPTEEKVRARLRENGFYGSSEYDLVYDRNGTELYVLGSR